MVVTVWAGMGGRPGCSDTGLGAGAVVTWVPATGLLLGAGGVPDAGELLACGLVMEPETQAGTDMGPDARVPAVTVVIGGCAPVR